MALHYELIADAPCLALTGEPWDFYSLGFSAAPEGRSINLLAGGLGNGAICFTFISPQFRCGTLFFIRQSDYLV